MIAHAVWTAVVAAGLFLTLGNPRPISAQLLSSDVLDVAGSGSTLAFTRGSGAIGANPAGLGLSGGPRWSVAILPMSMGHRASPLGWSDVSQWSGLGVPSEERARWIERVAGSGDLRSRVDANVTYVAVQVGEFGFQVGSRGTGRVALNEGAAEILLFGNAGRTGEVAELDLAGSSVDVEALTSVGLAWGRAIQLPSSESRPTELGFGVTMTYTEGHFLVMGRDDLSQVRAEPPEIDVRFPTFESESGSAGRGLGVSVGAIWSRDGVTLSAVAQDVLHGFRWREDAFRYRPISVFLSGTRFETETDLRPSSEAPESFRAALRSRGIDPRLRLGTVVDLSPSVALSGVIARGVVGDLPGSPTHRVAVGVRFDPSPIPLVFQGGVGVSGDGTHLGVGARTHWGPLALGAAIQGRTGIGGRGVIAALGLELRGADP